MAKELESSESFCMRSSTTTCLTRALAGIMTYLAILRSYARLGVSCRSSNSTRLCECATRVVMRRMTGVSYFSDSSNASLVNSFASALSDGSKTGTCALTAVRRVSCSFCEENTDGSSATAMTRPPFTPVYEAVKRGSQATFSPTCFMETMARAPRMDAPMPTSRATFSFGDHSLYTSSYRASSSVISVDGVPG